MAWPDDRLTVNVKQKRCFTSVKLVLLYPKEKSK